MIIIYNSSLACSSPFECSSCVCVCVCLLCAVRHVGSPSIRRSTLHLHPLQLWRGRGDLWWHWGVDRPGLVTARHCPGLSEWQTGRGARDGGGRRRGRGYLRSAARYEDVVTHTHRHTCMHTHTHTEIDRGGLHTQTLMILSQTNKHTLEPWGILFLQQEIFVMISPGCWICVARYLPAATAPRLIAHFKSSNTNKLVRDEAAAAEAHRAGREASPHMTGKQLPLVSLLISLRAICWDTVMLLKSARAGRSECSVMERPIS